MIFHQSMVKIIAGILAIIGLCVGVNVTFFQTMRQQKMINGIPKTKMKAI